MRGEAELPPGRSAANRAPMPADRPHAFPVLLADIGGTNSRFAILPSADAAAVELPPVRTSAFPSIEAAIAAAVPNEVAKPVSAVLAVAGPVDGDEIDLTNSHWVIRPKDVMNATALRSVTVLNDFEAQALAVAGMPDEFLVDLGGDRALENETRVVVGPGTGLGVGSLVRAGGRWVPVPGEGGHVDLGPRDKRDEAVWPHLERIDGRISAEQLLCGRGITNLYRGVCAAHGDAPVLEGPPAITEAAVERTDLHAIEALDLFAIHLGRVAGDCALTVMATGGVFISGGIGQHIVGILRAGLFREAFVDKAPHRAIMEQIATKLVVQPLAALSGLAAYARHPERFEVAIAHRNWTI